MVTIKGKYALILEAIRRFKSIGEDYQVWLDYQMSKGIVFVRPDYVSAVKQNTVYAIIVREMTCYEWCKVANSFPVTYDIVLLNSDALKGS